LAVSRQLSDCITECIYEKLYPIVNLLQTNPKLFFLNGKSKYITIEYILPKKEKGNNNKDPIDEFYTKNGNIINYLNETEIKDMKNVKKLFDENKNVNNIFLYQNTNGKNYDFGIIKFLENNKFILILCQITIRDDNDKFKRINLSFHKDKYYLNSKIEQFFPGYKSIGVNLIYIVPLHNNYFNIKYKISLDESLVDCCHLLFFDNNLNFYIEKDNILKNIKLDINKKITFDFSNVCENYLFYGKNLGKKINRITKLYNIELGDIYISKYDNVLIENALAITEKLFIIITHNKILHTIEYNGKLNEIFDENIKKMLENKKYYFIQIKNPNEVNILSVFNFYSLE